MKTKTLVAAVAFTSLLALGGTAFAADDAHDGYNRGNMGTTPPMGKGDHGTPGNTSAWSAGHDAYNRALVGTTPNKPQVDYMGKAAYGTSSSPIEGKAAYGSSSSSIDGNAAYRRSFTGD